jgi:exonuclease III
MPYYKSLFDEFTAACDSAGALRAASRLLSLRGQLDKLPPRTVSERLLLATWNLREFGRNQKYGPRLPESLHYIAEIVSRFDLVAIQEVHKNLHDLKRLMRILGDWWSYIVTDVTPGRSGNQERIAFVFDTRKVQFDGLAGELVLPPEKKKPVLQWARSPFVCAFRAGWRRISLCSVHIFYGTKDPDDPVRVAEIGSVAGMLAKRNTDRQESADGEPDNVILLGDFNVFHQDGDKTTEALERHRFFIPKNIRKLVRNKYYDQIAFHDPRRQLRPTTKAGVFDFNATIFRDDDAETYAEEMKRLLPKLWETKDHKKLYREWRTFQISDHCPLWIELKIDFADGYLAVRGGVNEARARQKAAGGNAEVLATPAPAVAVAAPPVPSTQRPDLVRTKPRRKQEKQT